MDTTTQFIDTVSLLEKELRDVQKHIAQLDKQLADICYALGKGDVNDKLTRLKKLELAKDSNDALQNFLTYAVANRVPHLYGSLSVLSTLLESVENEVWLVRGSGEELTAPQTVDHLTDAITDHMLAHQNDSPSPKSSFVDNPDSFVSDFVKNYLDHAITDRMSDMVISLVTDWMSFRLPD
ncbi:MAG: hypothetical protein K5657_05780 [Desulfovibrio sp.]|nr:hypothetical protein [Desulfovibrio sp.]